MTDREILLNMIDEFKEKISSIEYINIVEEISKIAKHDTYLLNIHYITYKTTLDDKDSGWFSKYDNEVNELILKFNRQHLT